MSSPAERSQIGKLGAYTSWSRTTNRAARTAPAREALEARFLAEADGDAARAAALRKAYFTRLALKSAQSRRRAKTLTEEASIAEQELRSLGGGAA